MEDLTALAERLSGSVGESRGALIVSRDGLVLGAHPADAESFLKFAWLRFNSLGEPERGFVQFGTEIWCFLRRGAYAAFVVTATTVRPGLVIDQMEMILLAADETRTRRDGLRAEPAAAPPTAAPSGKPRTTLHPDTRPAELPVVIHADVVPAASAQGAPAKPERADTAGSVAAPKVPPSPGAKPAKASSDEEGADSVWGASDDDSDEEVDRFSLAREFSQLLQEDSDGADG